MVEYISFVPVGANFRLISSMLDAETALWWLGYLDEVPVAIMMKSTKAAQRDDDDDSGRSANEQVLPVVGDCRLPPNVNDDDEQSGPY